LPRFVEFWLMKKAILIIILFNLFRLLVLPFTGMMPQDAYYYFYSEHLSLSYFDHPPMVAYMQYLFSLVFGKTVFSVKFTDFVLTAGMQVVFFMFVSKIIRSPRKYMVWVLLASTIMVTNLSLVTTPDVPLLLFWTLSLLMLYRAIFDQKKWYWIWAGLIMGLAFDSKYTAVALPAGLFLFLIFSTRYRKYLYTAWPYLSVILMALVSLPVFIWNSSNHFASFVFQSSERAEAISGFTPQNLAGLIGTQMFLLLPIVFIGLWWVMFKYFGRIFKKPNQINPELWFLLSFFVPLFLGFYTVSCFYWVKLNWLMPTYISGIVIMGKFIKYRWMKWHLAFSILFHVLVFTEVLFYPVPVKSDDTWFGWKELGNRTEQLMNTYPEAFVFSRDNYKTTAELMFFTKKKIFGKNIIDEHALHYDYIGDTLMLLKGKDAIYIDSHKQFKTDGKSGEQVTELKPFFKDVRELDPILIKLRGKTVRKFCVYYCTDYQGPKNIR